MGGTNLDFPKLRTSQQNCIMHVKKKKTCTHIIIIFFMLESHGQ